MHCGERTISKQERFCLEMYSLMFQLKNGSFFPKYDCFMPQRLKYTRGIVDIVMAGEPKKTALI